MNPHGSQTEAASRLWLLLKEFGDWTVDDWIQRDDADAGNDVWHQYDVTPDGQRFLVNMLPERAAASPITVVVNWPALLKK